MGGPVALTLRREEGTCVSRHVWTNYWSHCLMDPLFVYNGSVFFDDYLTNLDCQEDKPFAPISYGLIVVDYKTRKVFHSQNYTDFCSLTSLDFWPEKAFHAGQKSGGPDKRVLDLIDDGRVYHQVFNEDARKWRRGAQVSSWKEESVKVQAETLKVRQTGDLSNGQLFRYEVDLSPWEFVRFNESVEGVSDLRAELENAGFSFTKTDDSGWQNFLKHLQESEDT